MERTFCTLPAGPGTTVRVVLTDWPNGRLRLDIRRYFELRDGDPASATATRRGCGVSVHLVPQLRAAIEAAEREALRLGAFEPEDYTDHGLAVPDQA